jgi:hypothetical protein
LAIPDRSLQLVVDCAVWCELILSISALVLVSKDLIQLLDIKTILLKLVLEGLRGIAWYFMALLLLR